MDDHERMALRRRKPVFAESVEVNSELLTDLQARGLLGDDAIEQLKGEKNANQRASKLVDWLIECKTDHAFQEVCNVLVTKYPALSKDLQTEVRIERGDVVIDDDVMKEAATLVHRKFGTSRRFAETDKKDMTDLIAIKIQLSKEEWRHEMKQVRDELNRYISLCKKKDQSARDFTDSIAKFIKKYEEEMTSKAHDMTSTSDHFLTTVDDTDYFGKLKEKLQFLMQRTERVVEERELLAREREKAQRSLNDINKRMSTTNGASSAKEDEDKMKRDMDSKDALIKRLRKNNETLENESDKNERDIEELNETSKRQSEKIAELEEKIKQMELGKEATPKENALVPPMEKPRIGSSYSNKPSNNLTVKSAGTRKGSARK